MRKILPLIIFLIVVSSGTLYAQETYFGKNKVQYKSFDWQYIQTRHFDIYFADQMYESAKFASTVLESSYVVVSDQLNYRVHRRIPVFIYNSPNDFQQTNIIPSILSEAVGGFTEAFKNRIAVPFTGSTEDFRHVLHHELTHAVTYDMLYGNVFSSLISRQRLFDLPLWFAEGYAEYSSRYGWDYFADMVVRDATINNYLTPPEYLGGYLAYKEGQALVNYIVDNYGEEKLGEILAKGKIHLTMNKALNASSGITQKELWEGFSKEMKRRYWPEIAKRKEAGEIGKALTNHEKDGSGFNGNPIFSPKGDRLAIFSDRSDYIEIYLISTIDGQIIERLVKAERSGDLESLHSYLTGITFSPDGEKIAFVVKSDGKDALFFLTIENKKIYKRKYFDFNSILDPTWSPDGKKIAFAALDGRLRDIFVYDIENDSTYEIAANTYDDVHPSWFPDSEKLAFSSDRPHPDNDFILNNPDYTPSDSLDYWTLYGKFGYGNYSLFVMDVETAKVTPLKCGPGQNREPDVSPDGERISFVSNRNGIDNLYIMHVDSSTAFAVTDILTGVSSPSWSPNGKQIAFSSFNKAGFDVFLLKDIVPVGNSGVLEPTHYVKGKYKKKDEGWLAGREIVAAEEEAEPEIPVEEPDSVQTDSLAVAADSTSAEQKPSSDTTRVEDGEYIFVSEEPEYEDDPLSGIFTEVESDS
ncbi:MAG: PD40 domain-containing protein, partial [Candidatus Zixiibacteriota bacterium]